jgi:glycerate-2-kinase
VISIKIRLPTVPRILARLIRVGFTAVSPERAVYRAVVRRGSLLTVGRKTYRLLPHHRLIVLGAGKAAARMAAAVERRLGPYLTDGLVTTGYARTLPRTKRIRVIQAGHPVPDRAGMRAAARMLDMIEGLSPRDLVLVLLSGGASSLLPVPAQGLTLDHLRVVTNRLLRSGAPIQEVNAVRKHLSAVSGGRLAAATRARLITLVLSDVIGDDLGAIGSGPTAPDASTYRDVCDILRRRGIWRELPASVRAHLAAGLRGQREETPKPGSPIFRRVRHLVIGNNRAAILAVAQTARRAGLAVSIHRAPLVGDVRAAARTLASALVHGLRSRKVPRRPRCVIAGGEPTIRVTGNGRGGRAQECALRCASLLAGSPNLWLAAFGTDGVDGPTDAAGAIVTGATLTKARRRRINAAGALRRHDSYTFFKQVGGHILTGPTGTNVNDLFIGLAV